jgi:hypothetical protein
MIKCRTRSKALEIDDHKIGVSSEYSKGIVSWNSMHKPRPEAARRSSSHRELNRPTQSETRNRGHSDVASAFSMRLCMSDALLHPGSLRKEVREPDAGCCAAINAKPDSAHPRDVACELTG